MKQYRKTIEVLLDYTGQRSPRKAANVIYLGLVDSSGLLASLEEKGIRYNSIKDFEEALYNSGLIGSNR